MKILIRNSQAKAKITKIGTNTYTEVNPNTIRIILEDGTEFRFEENNRLEGGKPYLEIIKYGGDENGISIKPNVSNSIKIM